MDDHSLKHLQKGIDMFRAFEAMKLPKVGGRWRSLITDAESIVNRIQVKKIRSLRPKYFDAQILIDKAVEQAFIDKQQDAAAIASALLNSYFTGIRAQAHTLLARLASGRTPERFSHCEQARFRLQTLILAAPNAKDWNALLDVVNKIQHPPIPTTISLPFSKSESEQWSYMDAAFKLATSEEPSLSKFTEAVAIFTVLTESEHTGIRAMAHLRLSNMTQAGDRLYRKLEAFRAVQELITLQGMFMDDTPWADMLVQAWNALGNWEKYWGPFVESQAIDHMLRGMRVLNLGF